MHEAKVKDKKTLDLEAEMVKLKEDSDTTIKEMAKHLEDTTTAMEFKYESTKLELETAQIRLRELHEFSQKKAILEKELQDTRYALLKEREKCIEQVGEAERASYAAQEKMRRAMETIVAETEARMTANMEMRLNFKTKKIIIENEGLKAEVQYHTRATMKLYKENQRLIEENHERTRDIDLLQEIQAELELKIHAYQKTLRILLHKLRENEKQMTSTQAKVLPNMTKEQRGYEEDFQELLLRAERLKDVKISNVGSKLVHSRKAVRPHSTKSQELTQDSAIEFLYACLEDMELETFTKLATESASSSEAVPSTLPLDQLNMKQRLKLLQSLLKKASTVRLMTQSLANAASDKGSTQRLPYSPAINNSGENIVFDVQDLLEMPVQQIILGDRGK
ncbi:uncharacterized protein [Physcomitrium patens]|uniref:uncharacterized protein isoform X2 n=1 Tax=Physcomitrium patens TaxID=3218 RepID=UPI000D172639|nr:cilia- and flagella-associated protein 157-like isoform X2 [Physcomitrium patens]|eukprot:XP_024360435.1 cilia- and flagella-associated protein 157-like isoform X2 [Physcomitrella patens]